MTQAQQPEAHRFTKKPVTITASQWFKSGDHHAVRDISDSDDLFFTGMGGATLVEREKFGVIGTLESPNHLVTPGDWIITGVKGEHYPCKPDIFEATYALEQGKCLHQIAEPVAEHIDDLAVGNLAYRMKAKLAKQRENGYGGWDTDCTQERLSELLRQHVDKGDPVDVANFCAFLLSRGETIAAPQPPSHPATQPTFDQ